MNEPTMETLTRRLDRVERENRWLKRAGVVALAVIAAVMLVAMANGAHHRENARPGAQGEGGGFTEVRNGGGGASIIVR